MFCPTPFEGKEKLNCSWGKQRETKEVKLAHALEDSLFADVIGLSFGNYDGGEEKGNWSTTWEVDIKACNDVISMETCPGLRSKAYTISNWRTQSMPLQLKGRPEDQAVKYLLEYQDKL
jgi:hypothetical protein